MKADRDSFVAGNRTTVPAPATPMPAVQDAAAHGGTTTTRFVGMLATDMHKRLRILALIGTGTFAAGSIIALIVPPLLDKPASTTWIMAGLCGFLTLLSIAVWSLARSTQRHSRLIVRIALGYVVAAALAMAIAEVLLRQPSDTGYDGIPGLCIWIVLFPLIIPCRPSAALLTALACALALPLSYGLGLAFGAEALPTDMLIDWILPGFFCAGLSFAAATSVSKLTAALAAAREQIRQLGSYELQEELGAGGMGQVWRARHRLLPREAAVKFIKPLREREADPKAAQEMVARFEREAQAIALLQSPHTIQIFDFGLNDDGELYYAMELVDGMDLETLVEADGAQRQARVIHILRQVCRSLAEAHDKGLVHRDIKPGNIMLCQLANEYDVVKVLDFGIVGAMQEAAGLLIAGQEGHSGIAGTPGYIAPENLLGSGEPQPSADLYAIGAVGYWLLTGSTVFPDGSGGENLVAHTVDEAPPPSGLSPFDIDPDLDALIGACLAKQPDERPASAAQLERRLAALAARHPWGDDEARAKWTGDRPAAGGMVETESDQSSSS